jgi:ribosomal protein S18 acetylase RimI-like enzyme
MDFDGLEIIDFSEDWTKDFAALNYEWIEKYFAVEQHDREILDRPRECIIDPGGQIFMAIFDGQAAGTVALIPSAEDVMELTKMAVSPNFQGLGIGSKLMARCVEFAKERGVKIVFLESNRKLTPALNLYRKFGFVEVPEDPDSFYSRADIRMELDVNA